MKSVVLLPYAPWPVNTGGKAEMWRHLLILRDMGPCRAVSARRRPVGGGWTQAAVDQCRREGIDVVFRDDECRRTPAQWWGMAYAILAKGLHLERAFGHANPYHRYAFPRPWWQRQTEGADLAFINYSFWAGLPCRCPKVVNLLDLWSDFMWGGHDAELRDLSSADAILCLSVDEQETLRRRGLKHLLYVPPSVPAADLPDSPAIGFVGSANRFNREGLAWIEVGLSDTAPEIRLFGALAAFARSPCIVKRGSYGDPLIPFGECGIILMTTVQGMGVQIKSIEALAAGRAVVARRGAMRGLPPGDGAWVDVDTPEAMVQAASELQRNPERRTELAARARAFYRTHLDAVMSRQRLETVYRSLPEQARSVP